MNVFIGLTTTPVLCLLAAGLPGTAVLSAAVLGIVLVLPLSLISHEVAHAIAGKALGLEVGTIRIGTGLPLARFHLGDLPVSWKLLPMGGGVTLGSHNFRLLRTRLWITTLMGPAANIALAVAIFWLSHSQAVLLESSSLITALLTVAIIMNVFLAVGNLLPVNVAPSEGVTRTAGLALLQIPRTPQSDLELYRTNAFLGRALSEIEAGDFHAARRPIEIALNRGRTHAPSIFLYAFCCVRLGQFEEASHAQRPLLQELAQLPPGLRAAVCNNQAVAEVMRSCSRNRTSGTMQEADRLSEIAFSDFPCVLDYRSTRSIVLSALGESAAAELLLDYVHYETGSRQERTGQTLARAFALKVSGRTQEAYLLTEGAVASDPSLVIFAQALGLTASAGATQISEGSAGLSSVDI